MASGAPGLGTRAQVYRWCTWNKRANLQLLSNLRLAAGSSAYRSAINRNEHRRIRAEKPTHPVADLHGLRIAPRHIAGACGFGSGTEFVFLPSASQRWAWIDHARFGGSPKAKHFAGRQS